MDELPDRVAGAKVFTKIDLKDGYHLIQMRKGDEYKTDSRTRYGQYKYKVMPFSLVNGPCDVSDNDQQNPKGILGPRSSRLFR